MALEQNWDKTQSKPILQTKDLGGPYHNQPPTDKDSSEYC